ncbi:MAG: DcaP family trimeric outer membrane transporter, partial [Proteobacteria bacterium]|nr:DcaP family trimeric outer membrane transporter [Pseudomonadota bacterium]
SASARRDGRSRLHAKQSRFRFDSRTPTDWGMMSTRIEGDFFGAGGNQNASNSNSFRLRHAFGQLGPVLAGQTFTTFSDTSTYGDTIDFYGTAGAEFARQAMIRYSASLGEGLGLDLAVENPQSRIFFANAAGAVRSTNTNDQLPDFVARFTYNSSWGALNLSGVGRRFKFDLGSGGSDAAWGYGVHAGANVNLWEGGNIGVLANFGDGIGRYITGGLYRGAVASCSNDVNPGNAACNVDVETLWQNSGMVRLTHKWTDNIRSNVHYGFVRSELPTSQLLKATGNVNAVVDGLNRSVDYMSGNIIWSPVSRVNIGLEVMHGWRDSFQVNSTNNTGEATRVQLGMQYTF